MSLDDDLESSLRPALGARFLAMPRLVAMLNAAPGIELEQLGDALNAWRAGFAERWAGSRPILRLGLRYPDGMEMLQRGLPGRPLRIERMDAAIELSLPNFEPTPRDFEALVIVAKGILESLDPVIDRASCTALAGAAQLIVSGEGPTFVAFALKRDPGISLEQANRWWTESHAELTIRHARPFPLGYQQLHVALDLSRRVCDAAGLAIGEYDMFDCIYCPSPKHFEQGVRGASEEDLQRAIDDERGHIAYGTWRGAICRLL